MKLIKSWLKKTILVFTLATICVNHSAVSGEIEILLGDEQIFVNSNGQVKKSDSLPEIITPDGFQNVVQPQATGPSKEISKSFKRIRERKKRNSKIFTFDSELLDSSELTPLLSDALKRPQVIVSLNQYSSKGNKKLSLAQDRLKYYQPIFHKIFEEEGVPNELISIGFVESTFNPKAVSPSGAKGIWQFIPSTGKMFGLTTQEDFTDPVKSTKAAAKYLKRLHKRFGDWLLVLAAYNAGDYRVQQAINMSNGNKDFWELSKYLPNETRNYVPRVIAAVSILQKINPYSDSQNN
ncbi:MAG: lytic transglycosylase domain-containing protein [Candidatus Caenarcaniphilales bacterium]|nr:lytic transglycosylase domain-containing protein [Candidatus Caenarcaniphilales bacterium]